MVKFFDAVKKHNMFSPGQKVLVGLSGGADSMCLVSLLVEYAGQFGISVEAAHVNHCIRGEEALRDERFVRRFCDEKGIPLHVLTADIPAIAKETGESTELCARRIRYEFFDSLEPDVIATAHTGSDRIETMLMNLSRGASLSGLCSIPPVRGNIVRPLIGVLRSEIEQYCTDQNIDYITDSTNLSDDYTRNKFRHNVVAELVKINPAFEKNALRCIESINEEEKFFVASADRLYQQYVKADGSLDISELHFADTALCRRIIKQYIISNSDSDFEMKHIDSVIDRLGSCFSVVLPGNVILSGDKNRIFFKENIKKSLSIEDIVLKKGQQAEISQGEKTLIVRWSEALPANTENLYYADAAKVCDEICIRARRPGDVFNLGKRRCSKTLKKLFNEMKIPAEKRDSLFVVADDNGLIFAEEIGIDSKRSINKYTQGFLIIKTEGGKNNE